MKIQNLNLWNSLSVSSVLIIMSNAPHSHERFFIPDLDYLVDLKGLISYLCEKVGMYYMCLY